MKNWIGLGAVFLLAVPAGANAQTTDDAELRAAITAAIKAKTDAEAALKRAKEAIDILQRSLAARPPAPTPDPAAPPAPSRATFTTCDAAGQGGVAAYMLQMYEDRRTQKKEGSQDDREKGSNTGINKFVYDCLGLKKATDYENTINLSAQFTAAKGGDQIETAISRTTRALKLIKGNSLKPDPADLFAATYRKLWVGGFARTGSDGTAQVIDLTTSNFASGVGVAIGFEWGRMPSKSRTKLLDSINSGLAKARRDCIAEHGIAEPLTTGKTGRPVIALDAITACEGNQLADWMKDNKRANKYWKDIVSPLWGYGGEPEAEIFYGIQGRYAFQDLSYRPVIDPRTGAVIVLNLPPEIEIHPETYSLKIYGGFNRPILDGKDKKGTYGLTGSLSYRREVAFIGGPTGKTVCVPAAPGATFQFCDSDQKLSAPYDTKGFIVGLELNLQARRFWYLPEIGLAPRVTYAFDTKRFGFEVPVYFMTDADGKLNSGVRYTCNLKGRTAEGFELKKSCSVNLFVGTSFEIRRTP